MSKIQDLASGIEALSLLEVSKLVELLEERLGVSASAPQMVVSGAVAAASEPEEEKTEFDVILIEAGAKKIDVIKEIRALTSLGLKEAKDMSEQANSVVKSGVSKADAEEAKKKLEAAGAKVKLA